MTSFVTREMYDRMVHAHPQPGAPVDLTVVVTSIDDARLAPLVREEIKRVIASEKFPGPYFHRVRAGAKTPDSR